jgi:hypothetical protein
MTWPFSKVPFGKAASARALLLLLLVSDEARAGPTQATQNIIPMVKEWRIVLRDAVPNEKTNSAAVATVPLLP